MFPGPQKVIGDLVPLNFYDVSYIGADTTRTTMKMMGEVNSVNLTT